VFTNIGWGEFLMLAVVGMLLFGPERLPEVIRDVGRVVRQLRRMALDARDELKSELGPEVADLDLSSLNPREYLRRQWLDDDPPEPHGAVRAGPGVPAPAPAPSLRKSTPGDRTPYDLDAT
jgi:sec-independent protein translocase protein TatB